MRILSGPRIGADSLSIRERFPLRSRPEPALSTVSDTIAEKIAMHARSIDRVTITPPLGPGFGGEHKRPRSSLRRVISQPPIRSS
ncbi:hypothetical protein L1787_10400 [Acuticoccus sp. M5D2P5]|uniref:hypothetical protein n=1 Tax=Acuticoccus kalidii TaxID=2910977 RepID=UPI001F197021|nr:hypothetical protein [Acuticoccus kalidii]MCF3933824.1 hypothetical protein [Acuticoccus kalidii]